jgi:hypothetical protein
MIVPEKEMDRAAEVFYGGEGAGILGLFYGGFAEGVGGGTPVLIGKIILFHSVIR